MKLIINKIIQIMKIYKILLQKIKIMKNIKYNYHKKKKNFFKIILKQNLIKNIIKFFMNYIQIKIIFKFITICKNH